jgi:hypothetical protein
MSARSTESNLLKELWTPNLFRLLLTDELSLLSNDVEADSLINELTYSEIGFPVTSDHWFEYLTNSSSSLEIENGPKVNYEQFDPSC